MRPSPLRLRRDDDWMEVCLFDCVRKLHLVQRWRLDRYCFGCDVNLYLRGRVQARNCLADRARTSTARHVRHLEFHFPLHVIDVCLQREDSHGGNVK